MILLWRLAPALPWIPWLPVALLAALMAKIMSGFLPDLGSRHLHLRSGLLLAAIGLTFVFDDPAAETTDAIPSPLRLRRVLRVLLALIPWLALVLGVIWAAAQPGPEGDLVGYSEVELVRPHAGRLLLEAATLGAWGLAIAALVASRWDREPGKIAAPALLAIFAASWVIPQPWSPWALPPGVHWEATRTWWWGALALGLALASAWSWDTRHRAWAQRPTWWLWQRRSGDWRREPLESALLRTGRAAGDAGPQRLPPQEAEAPSPRSAPGR